MKILYVAYKDKANRTIVPIRKFHAIDDNGKVNEKEPSTLELLIVEEQRTTSQSFKDFEDYKKQGLLKQVVI